MDFDSILLPKLTLELLQEESFAFAAQIKMCGIPELYGISDGKAIGTCIENKFFEYLKTKYNFLPGNASSGLDFPELDVDIKTTLASRPNSSCPFRSPRQKIYGIGYNLIVFLYEKYDNKETHNCIVDIQQTLFIDKRQSADYQLTKDINEIIKNNGNSDDIFSYIKTTDLPIDDIEAKKLSEEIIKNPPEQGYLSISNALQWRIRYNRVIENN